MLTFIEYLFYGVSKIEKNSTKTDRDLLDALLHEQNKENFHEWWMIAMIFQQQILKMACEQFPKTNDDILKILKRLYETLGILTMKSIENLYPLFENSIDIWSSPELNQPLNKPNDSHQELNEINEETKSKIKEKTNEIFDKLLKYNDVNKEHFKDFQEGITKLLKFVSELPEEKRIKFYCLQEIINESQNRLIGHFKPDPNSTRELYLKDKQKKYIFGDLFKHFDDPTKEIYQGAHQQFSNFKAYSDDLLKKLNSNEDFYLFLKLLHYSTTRLIRTGKIKQPDKISNFVFMHEYPWTTGLSEQEIYQNWLKKLSEDLPIEISKLNFPGKNKLKLPPDLNQLKFNLQILESKLHEFRAEIQLQIHFCPNQLEFQQKQLELITNFNTSHAPELIEFIIERAKLVNTYSDIKIDIEELKTKLEENKDLTRDIIKEISNLEQGVIEEIKEIEKINKNLKQINLELIEINNQFNKNSTSINEINLNFNNQFNKNSPLINEINKLINEINLKINNLNNIEEIICLIEAIKKFLTKWTHLITPITWKY